MRELWIPFWQTLPKDQRTPRTLLENRELLFSLLEHLGSNLDENGPGRSDEVIGAPLEVLLVPRAIIDETPQGLGHMGVPLHLLERRGDGVDETGRFRVNFGLERHRVGFAGTDGAADFVEQAIQVRRLGTLGFAQVSIAR